MTEPNEYTPTIEQFLGFANTALIASGMPEGEAFRTTERVLAAHDAEVRAGVVAEEPEWEYRVRDSVRWHNTEAEARAESNARRSHEIVQRRRKAGPWVPVKQEGGD